MIRRHELLAHKMCCHFSTSKEKFAMIDLAQRRGIGASSSLIFCERWLAYEDHGEHDELMTINPRTNERFPKFPRICAIDKLDDSHIIVDQWEFIVLLNELPVAKQFA